MAISAALVKELRERTGVGLMECKKALQEVGGDIDLAIESLRKSGQTKAAKKSGRATSEGAIAAKVGNGRGALVEVNCETDFVARDENFIRFITHVVTVVWQQGETDVAQLSQQLPDGCDGRTIEQLRQELVQKVGENIQLRRATFLTAPIVGAYTHQQKIGVLVGLDKGSEQVAKEVAMHVAAMNPLVLNPQDVPKEVQEKEREIYLAQARDSGKPEPIVEKMVAGRLRKYLEEISLSAQAFVKDPQKKVADVVAEQDAEIQSFLRFAVGES